VRRLTPSVRSRATYDRSLAVLALVKAKEGARFTPNRVLCSAWEKPKTELFVAMNDLRTAGCDILTLGQYLQPTLRHLPVVEYVRPENSTNTGIEPASWVSCMSPAARWAQLLPCGRVSTPERVQAVTIPVKPHRVSALNRGTLLGCGSAALYCYPRNISSCRANCLAYAHS